MKNFVYTVALLCLGVVSCSACAKKDTTPDAAPIPTVTVPPVPTPTTITASVGNVSIVLPGLDWKKLESEDTIAGYLNTSKKNVVVLGREPFTGTRDAYILQSLRGIKDVGATLVSTKQVTLNGHNFVLFESTKDISRVWSWVTLESGFGIAFSCAGVQEVPEFSQHDVCFGIADSLKIN